MIRNLMALVGLLLFIQPPLQPPPVKAFAPNGQSEQICPDIELVKSIRKALAGHESLVPETFIWGVDKLSLTINIPRDGWKNKDGVPIDYKSISSLWEEKTRNIHWIKGHPGDLTSPNISITLQGNVRAGSLEYDMRLEWREPVLNCRNGCFLFTYGIPAFSTWTRKGILGPDTNWATNLSEQLGDLADQLVETYKEASSRVPLEQENSKMAIQEIRAIMAREGCRVNKLAGIKRISPTLWISEEIEGAGTNRANKREIRDFIELRLRLAGAYYDPANLAKDIGSKYSLSEIRKFTSSRRILRASVNGLISRATGSLICNVDLELEDECISTSNGSTINGAIWESSTLCTFGPGHDWTEKIKNKMGTLLDEFLLEWVKENPVDPKAGGVRGK